MKSLLRPFLALLLPTTIGLGALHAANLRLVGENDRPSPFYEPGETMTFRIRLQEDGQPVTGTRLAWTRTGDDGRTESGEASSATEPLILTASTDRPGFVRIRVRALDAEGKPLRDDKNAEVVFDGGAGVQPEKLESIPEPADFDAWWSAQKAALARVPLEVLEFTSMPATAAHVDTWDVKIACAGLALPGEDTPRPVSGYLSITRGAAPGSAEAVVNFHGYGVRSATRNDDQANDPAKPKIVFNINAHGIENGRPADFYKQLEQTLLKGYAFDRKQNEHPETAYLYGMALRVLRALEFVKSRPEWDGKRLTASGGSQGAFQSILAAALDPDVTRCDAWKPWFTDLGGVNLGRLKGWRPDYTPALGYYDTVNLAKRIRAVTYITSGLGDYVCPPSGVTVLYNNIPASVYKRIEYKQGATHATSPADAATFVIGTRP